MLTDMLDALVDARTDKEKEQAYRNLERVGMDRRTAMALLTVRRKERDYGRRH